MRTSPLAIVLFIIAAFLGALGQFFYKSGAEKADSALLSYLFNARLLSGVVCYVAVMVLWTNDTAGVIDATSTPTNVFVAWPFESVVVCGLESTPPP